jgi:hypothetical protein
MPNSPISIRSDKVQLAEDATGFGSLYLTSNAASHEAALRLGHGIYDRYYRDPVEVATPSVNRSQRRGRAPQHSESKRHH